MGNRALRTTVGLAWCCAMAIPRAEAQLAPLLELQPGTRVRVQAPGVVAGSLEATVVTRARDTVILATSRGARVPVPLAAITTAEVSRGRSHRDGAVKGLAWGTAVGLATGLLSAVIDDAASATCAGEPCANDGTPGETVAASFVTGAALGASIGAIVGAEHWERLTIVTTYIALRPMRRGLAFSLAIPFTIRIGG